MPRERPELFTVEFWQHTVTQAVHGFAGGALSPLVAHQANLIGSVPWYGSLASGGLGAAISFLASLLTVRVPDRVPGSFLKETEEEKRVERAIMREEAMAKERQRLRERNEEVLMDERHRAPEPEPRAYADEHLVTGVPPERVVRQEEPLPYQPQQQRPPPEPTRPQPPPEQPVPHMPRYDTPDWQPPPQRPVPKARPRSNIPGVLGKPDDDMEKWPQGGKRGKKEEDRET